MPNERTARVIELSKRFRELASTLRDRVFEALEREEITKQEFRAFESTVQRPLLQQVVGDLPLDQQDRAPLARAAQHLVHGVRVLPRLADHDQRTGAFPIQTEVLRT